MLRIPSVLPSTNEDRGKKKRGGGSWFDEARQRACSLLKLAVGLLNRIKWERGRRGRDTEKEAEDCRRLNHFNRGNTEKKRREEGRRVHDLHPLKTRSKAEGKIECGPN